jgi:hypothetical protein
MNWAWFWFAVAVAPWVLGGLAWFVDWRKKSRERLMLEVERAVHEVEARERREGQREFYREIDERAEHLRATKTPDELRQIIEDSYARSGRPPLP